MAKNIYESLIQLTIILPMIFFFLRKYNKITINRILAFCIIFISYKTLLIIPKNFDSLNIIKGSWNWDGKILGIMFGVFCYFLFRHLFNENDYFRLKQDKTYFKSAAIVSVLVVMSSFIIWYIFGKSEFNLESLAFQLTLPGIDEEIMYRGVLLGLLMSVFQNHEKFGNPGLLITSILFGLVHALKLEEAFIPKFSFIYFIQTALAGYAWGWATVKSRSVVLAIFSHNFSNFFGTLAMMLK